MTETSTARRVREWATSQRNVTIYTAVLVAVPAAFAFREIIDASPGSLLLLLTLGVSVPRIYDEYWPAYRETWQAVVWILVACAIAGAQFTGLYILGTRVIHLSPLAAGVGAFVITDLGNSLWLAVRTQTNDGSGDGNGTENGSDSATEPN
jgi:preprotein translocase subunit SecE